MPSLVRQIEMALLAVYRPGVKKHHVPAKLRHRWVYSGRSLENYLYLCNWWAEWAGSEVGLRRLVNAHAMGQPWVQNVLIDGDYSAWTIGAALSALRKLESGIRARWHRNVTLVNPENLVERPKRFLRDRRRRGAYTADEITALRLYLAPQFRQPFEAMLALGLRRHEVIALRARDVDLTAQAYAVWDREGTWRAEPMLPGYMGIVKVRRGKGGRPREVPVPEEYLSKLEEHARAARDPGQRLYPVQARALHRAIWDACSKAGIPSGGVHSLRHSWAQRQHQQVRSLGYGEGAARQLVSWWLGHDRIAVTASYVPVQTRSDR